MPLHVKCGKCGRGLILDEVFNGAYCRCRHCRSLIQVPRFPQYAAKRPVVRIERPALASERRRTASAAQAIPAAVKPASPAEIVLSRLRTSPAITLGSSFGAILIVVAAWGFSGSPQAAPKEVVVADQYVSDLIVADEQTSVSDDPLLALKTAPPLETYFGLSLTGTTIGYVVDGDSSMAPYIDDVAFVTNIVNETLDSGQHRLGIVMATGEQGRTILEVHEPSSDMIGARSVLTARLPSGKTNLAKALSTTGGWFADTVFLVFAKPIGPEELDLLTENAEQTGAVTHVIALGEASRQPGLAAISSATGGKFLPVADENLRDLVLRVQRSLHERDSEDPGP